MKNIAVLNSGGGTNFQAIADAINSGNITNGRICVLIASKADAYSLTRAQNEGIPGVAIVKKDYADTDAFEDVLIETLEEYQTDLIVFAGYMTVLSRRVTDRYESRMLNIHPALIPSFCGQGFYGLRVHQAVLDAGVKLTGATVHFANGIVDGGPIILQKAVSVLDSDTPESLQQRVMVECEQVILPQAIDLICNDRVEIVGNKTRIK